MNNLFLIPINYSNGLQIEILDLISFIAILSGILVVTNKNPIISVLFLIGLFLSISAYLLLIGLNFIGFAYLLVYIGAISILFLFILMLINIRISELISNSKNSIPLALFIGIITYFIFYQVLYTNTQHSAEYPLGNNINKVNYVSSNTWEGNIIENIDIASIGNVLYTNYSLWLIIASLILLLAMIGAIAITTTPKYLDDKKK